MKTFPRINSRDIPQADSFSTIRQVVEAVAKEGKLVRALCIRTKFSERHIRYRLEGSRILGLLNDNYSITALGHKLLGTRVGSAEELETFRQGIKSNKTILLLAPEILSTTLLDLDQVTERISNLSELALSTAERRAVVLRAWQKTLLGIKKPTRAA